MDFIEDKGRHFIVAGDLKVLINHYTRPDPEAFGAELPGILKTILDNEIRVFDLYYTGDSKFLIHSNYEPQGLTANVSELRRDGQGMNLPASIPRVAESTGLPIVAAKNFGEDTGFHFHEFEVPFRHVSTVVMESMRHVINADGDALQ